MLGSITISKSTLLQQYRTLNLLDRSNLRNDNQQRLIDGLNNLLTELIDCDEQEIVVRFFE